MSAPTPPPAIAKPRPYRRYLTSALHTRFVHAALLALLTGYVFALSTGNDIFWTWFPLGPAGVKALLFSMCSLFIFILQLATLTIGRKTSNSSFAYLRGILFDLSTYQTFLWYTISAWWFCEAYIWAVPDSKELGWIISGGLSEPDRLNERPIYLRFFCTALAFVHAGIHLWCNHSSLHIPVANPASPSTNDVRTHHIGSVSAQMSSVALPMAVHSLMASTIASISAPFVYRAFFRNLFWQIHLAFAKPFFNLPRSDANPPDVYFIGMILGAAFFIGIALSLLWEISVHSFLVYIKQEPLKKGLPLSAVSKDPNGTLLTGLLAKRDVVKTFAFWELAIIAQKHPDRRKAIFADFDRPTGAMWTSMYRAALKTLSDIDDRILRTLPAPAKPEAAKPEINHLPRITRDVTQQAGFAPLPPASSPLKGFMISAVKSGAKAVGQVRDPWHPPIDESKQWLVDMAKKEFSDQKQMITKYSDTVTITSISSFFRTRPSSYVAGVVLGSPVGNASIIVDAVEALTKMLVASLSEDSHGKVFHTVPDTVRQFTRTITLVEGFMSKNLQAIGPDDKLELAEVIIVTQRIKAGLRELLSAFQLFLNDVGLAIKDLNEAKKVCDTPPVTTQLQQRQQQQRQQQQQQEEASNQVSNSQSSRNQSSSLSSSSSSSGGRGLRSNEDNQNSRSDRYVRENQQAAPAPRRIEASSSSSSSSSTTKRTSSGSNGDGNVFGARDPNAQNSRRRQQNQQRPEMEQVRVR